MAYLLLHYSNDDGSSSSHLELLQQGRSTLRRNSSRDSLARNGCPDNGQLAARLKSMCKIGGASGGGPRVTYGENVWHEYHVSESSSRRSSIVAQEEDEKDEEECFAGIKDDRAEYGDVGPVAIVSKRGTVRGVRNRVRRGIATFLRDPKVKVGPNFN